MAWARVADVTPAQYSCGHCDHKVASNKAFQSASTAGHTIYICPNCDKPTFFEGHLQIPGIALGEAVPHLPDGIRELYDEARRSCSVSAFTASVLACRKLLMNIAVSKGAKEGLKFIEYVEHLSAAGYIPPDGKTWVDHIRKKGNEATHEIALMNADDAKDLVTFAEMLLRLIYEFPNRVPKPKA